MALLFQWRAADGTLVNLNDFASGYEVKTDTTGLNSPSYELSSNQFAGIDGVKVETVRASAREITLAMMVRAGSEAQLRTRSRALVRALRPKAGPGTLTVTTEVGEKRTISCYCTGGLEGDESRGATVPGRWWRFALKLTAPSPWWLGDTRTINFGLAAPTPFFPIFPLVLSSSNIQGALTVDLSDADAPSYPVWTVTGPGTALTLTNVTTGRSIQVNAPIGDGQTLVIDTRPGMQSVRDGNGNNLMGSLASDPALFPLMEGVNQISALLAGAGAGSSIQGVYQPSYAGI